MDNEDISSHTLVESNGYIYNESKPKDFLPAVKKNTGVENNQSVVVASAIHNKQKYINIHHW